ncbi:MAG: flavin reductase family protein [Deltaproteobacteria bacterium]|nr:flavin reductase family protein [Deltaproteobacteria bacterium]
MRLDCATLEDHELHDLMKACVVPRPIAWVSTVGADGVANAAPFSCFTFVAVRPPMLAFSVELRRDGSKKDTLRNIESTGEFVVNVVPERLAEAMNATADDLPPEVDEIALVGLAAVSSRHVAAPRIAECPIAMECRLLRLLPLEPSRNTLVLGEVLAVEIDEQAMRDGAIDAEAWRPLARLDGNRYARQGELFELDRPWLDEKGRPR